MLSKTKIFVMLLILLIVTLTGCTETTSENIEVAEVEEELHVIDTTKEKEKEVKLVEAEIKLTNRSGSVSRSDEQQEERVSLENRGVITGNLDLPPHFRYKEIDYDILRDFLNSRNSEIAKNGRLKDLDAVAKKYDIDPLLYVAIIGAEQSLVPESPQSHLIILNPFNLYGSWMEYGKAQGATFKKSLDTVSKTILNLMKGYRYSHKDPYVYLNTYYAEDKNWHNNVRDYHQRMIKQQNN